MHDIAGIGSAPPFGWKPATADIWWRKKVAVENIYGIKHETNCDTLNHRTWLKRNYLSLLEERENKYDESMRLASLKYGEICLPDHDDNQKQYIYSDRFGLREI